GNQGGNVTDTVAKDATVPTGYSVSFDQGTINSTNETALSFTFAGAEVGATYNYSIDDTNGGTSAVTGSGTISTATDQITGINVSSLDDDTLTLTVYLADTSGNQGGNVTDTVAKDATAPTGYSVSFDQGTINNTNETALSFTFASAEVGATYNYSIDDTNGGTSAVTSSGSISTATDTISSINVSSLDDDTLTLTVYLTDAASNQGGDQTDTVTKDTTAPSGYSVSIDQADINGTNETALSFTFANAEVGATYNYSIDDTNGSTSPVTDNGTISSATLQISSIDVSSLDDDTLTLTVYLTDTNGNQGGNSTDTVTKTTSSTPATIDVSGHFSLADGTYSKSGTENGKDYWVGTVWSGSQNVDAKIYWHSGRSRWEMWDTTTYPGQPEFYDYYNTADSDVPPDDQNWYDLYDALDTGLRLTY
ncbi:MAG: hypothetical protein GY702_06325, partial [Desulfobulbaceae bacterium]|nr:hypothetical protein [Desulfobulbaceae bacterium]